MSDFTLYSSVLFLVFLTFPFSESIEYLTGNR